ncbi:MAG: hypothetical protein ACW967_10760 [Candidatus Hodarchaeales archaeon]|jgi:hypothetical protein
MALGIGVGVREVELESLHRASSELANLIFRYKMDPVEKAADKAFQEIASKYLTGIEDRGYLFEKLKLDYFFPATLEFLIKTYSLASKASDLDPNAFKHSLIEIWNEFKDVAPIAHIFYLLSGERLELGESIRYLTGNVVTDSTYRKYLIQKKYPGLQFYFDAYDKFKIFSFTENEDLVTEISTKIQEGCKNILSNVFSYFAEIFQVLALSESMDKAEDKLMDFVYINLKEWKDNEIFYDLLIGIFGTAESTRLELKYCGIATEDDEVKSAIQKLKDILSQDIDYKVNLDELNKEDSSIRKAIEAISALRKKKVVLETKLERKIFAQGLNPTERNILFEGIFGLNFREYIKSKMPESSVDVYTLDSMGLDQIYQQVFGEDHTRTVIKHLEEVSDNVQDAQVVGQQSALVFDQIVQILTNNRKNIDFDNKLRLKAVFNGLEDQEAQAISELVFSVPTASRTDIYNEFFKISNEKDKFEKSGIKLDEFDNLKDTQKKLKEFLKATLKYGLSPVLECYDLAINIINWTKENVNDIFISLGAGEADFYVKNLGKYTIHELSSENTSIFPVLRNDSTLLIAYMSLIITKEKTFKDLLDNVAKESLIVENYLGIKDTPIPKLSKLWTVSNEIWFRHLKRQIKEKKVDAKAHDLKLTVEEKARRAYNMFENALAKYTYSIKSKQGIRILGIRHEDSILECVKFIWTNNPKDLFETEFQLGDENLNFGSIKLLEAITSIISSNQDEVKNHLLELLNPIDDQRQQFLSAKIVDLFNKSLVQDTGIVPDTLVLNQIRKICSKYQQIINPGAVAIQDNRNKLLQKLIHEMGKELLELHSSFDPVTQKNVEYFQDVLYSIFDTDVLDHIKKLLKYDEVINPEKYKKMIDEFARYIWGKGIKKNTFTIFLNHLLVEKTRGSAEIGTEYWKRYAERCRYILKRIDQTCQIVK